MPSLKARLERRFNQLSVFDDDPAHVAFVTACSAISKAHLLAVLYLITKRNRTTACFLNEMIDQFMPSWAEPARLCVTVYWAGHHWFTRTGAEWDEEHSISRKQLEKAYKQCADFLIIGHFRSERGDRQTHYRLDYTKLVDLITHNAKYQRLLTLSVSRVAVDE